MIKQFSIIALSLLSFCSPSPLLASSDIGFTIKKADFSLTVRFGIADIDEVEAPGSTVKAEEITSADKLLFECIRWVYNHEKSLSRMKADVVAWLDIPAKRFDLQVDDLETKPISYKTGKLDKKLLGAVSKLLKIPDMYKAGPEFIPLYIIKSEEYLDGESERTDISLGAIPGYTYSYSENVYVVFLWSLDNQLKWIDNLRKAGATVEHVNASRKYLKDLLGQLE